MSELRDLLLYLVRYVPDEMKGEFINVAVVLMDQTTGEAAYRITHDYRRLKCLDPYFDPNLLMQAEESMRSCIADPGAFAQWMQNPQWPSNILQLTVARGIEAADMAAELRIQANYYLKTRRHLDGKTAASTTRKGISTAVRNAFRNDAELARFVQFNIPISGYIDDDPFVMDCGYEVNGRFNMLHGVSLRRDVNAVKALAFTYSNLIDPFVHKSGLKPHLTAVVDDRAPAAHYEFADRTFAGSNIAYAQASQLPVLVEHARKELGL